MIRDIRTLPCKAELRDNNGQPVAFGVPVVFGAVSHVLYGSFRETFAPGAFDKYLRDNPEVLCLAHHNRDQVLGRSSKGTLRYTVGSSQIDMECDLPNTTYGADLRENLKRGDIQGMSFGFEPVTDEWRIVDDMPQRTVTEARLYEFSFVGDPAYPATSAGVRAVEYYKDCIAQLKPNTRQRELWRWKLRILDRK